MFTFFGKGGKGNKQLDAVIEQIKVDLSNNYKDNAIEGIKKLTVLLEGYKQDNVLKESDIRKYTEILKNFEDDVKNFKRTY